MGTLKGSMTFAKTAALTSALLLAGCGTDPGDRAVSGGMIGAGAGAIIGAATGTAATGAAIGALSGAAIGAATNPCDLDLGDPYWHDHGGRGGYDRRCGRHYRRHRDDDDLKDDNED
ncbi:MAG TPA: YMGG-like glycine zipper-containing protein [Rhizomicrobium sp.]|nr:YMGG-like glycine zipper-containing protein [Rhizomicrobium sp.]